MAIGVPGHNRVFVVYGGPSVCETGEIQLIDLDGQDGFIITNPIDDEDLGSQDLSTGDFNYDGAPDLLISKQEPYSYSPHYAYIVFGNSNGVPKPGVLPPTLIKKIPDIEVDEKESFGINIADGFFAHPQNRSLTYRLWVSGHGAFPAGVTYDPLLKILGGLPNRSGVTRFVASAADPFNLTIEDNFALIVHALQAESDHTVRNATIGGVLSGLIGLGFLLIRILINRYNKSLLDETLKSEDSYQRNTVAPLVMAINDHIQVRNSFTCNSETELRQFGFAVGVVLRELRAQGALVDFSQMTSHSDQNAVKNIILSAIKAVSKPSYCHWLTRLCCADITVDQIEKRAKDIASQAAPDIIKILAEPASPKSVVSGKRLTKYMVF